MQVPSLTIMQKIVALLWCTWSSSHRSSVPSKSHWYTGSRSPGPSNISNTLMHICKPLTKITT
jgi:hypothetical protein